MLIGITGLKNSGKDTTARMIQECYPSFEIVHFADKLKEIALVIDPYILVNPDLSIFQSLSDIVKRIGWDEAKKIPDVRHFLQKLGTDVVRRYFGMDVWINLLFKIIVPGGDYIIPDVRFLNEAKSIRSREVDRGIIIRIIRPGTNDDHHASETEQEAIRCDYTIHNDGDFSALKNKVKTSMANWGITGESNFKSIKDQAKSFLSS